MQHLTIEQGSNKPLARLPYQPDEVIPSVRLDFQIQQLIALWKKIVREDHHAPGDLEWVIETHWETGQAHRFVVRHEGFLVGRCTQNFRTIQESQEALIGCMQTAIELQFLHALADLQSGDEVNARIAGRKLAWRGEYLQWLEQCNKGGD